MTMDPARDNKNHISDHKAGLELTVSNEATAHYDNRGNMLINR